MEQEGKKWLFSGSSDFVPPHEAAYPTETQWLARRTAY